MRKITPYILLLYIFGLSNCSSDKEETDYIAFNNRHTTKHKIVIDDIDFSFGKLNAKYLGVKQQGGNAERLENYLAKSAQIKTYFNAAILSVYTEFFKQLDISEENLSGLITLKTHNYKHEITHVLGTNINAEHLQQNNKTKIDFSALSYNFCGEQEKGLQALVSALRDSVLLVLSDEPFIHDFQLPTTFAELEENLPKTKHLENIITYVFKELYMDVSPIKHDERFHPENTLYQWIDVKKSLQVEEALLKLNHLLLNLRLVEKMIYAEYVEFLNRRFPPFNHGLVLLKNHSVDRTQYDLYYSLGAYYSDKIRYSFDPDLPKNEWTLIEKDYEESPNRIKGIPLDTVFTESTVIYFQTYDDDSKSGYWSGVYSDTIEG